MNIGMSYLMCACILHHVTTTDPKPREVVPNGPHRDAELWPGQAATDWQEASTFCQQQHGQLITIRDHEALKNISMALDSNSMYWIGGVINQSGWMWAKDSLPITSDPLGCFRLPVDNGRVVDHYPNNQPQICINSCYFRMHRAYALLQDDKCFCANHTEKYKKVGDSECNIACPGDPKQMCGGKETNTIYNAISPIKWQSGVNLSVKEDKSCAALMLSSDGVPFWYSDDCSYESSFICRYDDSTMCKEQGNGVPCYITNSSKVSWQAAAVFCEQSGGHLAQLKWEDEHIFEKLKQEYYWIGLTRKNAMWTDGRHIIFDPVVNLNDTKREKQLCLGLVVHNGNGNIIGKPCEEQGYPLCLIDTNVTRDPHSQVEVHSTSPTNTRQYTVYIYAAVGGSMVLVVIVVSIVVVRMRQRRLQSIQENMEEEHVYIVLDPEMVKNELLKDSVHNKRQKNSDFMFTDGRYNRLHKRKCTTGITDVPHSCVVRQQIRSENGKTSDSTCTNMPAISDSNGTLYTQPGLTDSRNDLGENDHLYDKCNFRRSSDTNNTDTAKFCSMPCASAGNTLNRKCDASAGNTLNRKCDASAANTLNRKCDEYCGYDLDERLYESVGSLVPDESTVINDSNIWLSNYEEAAISKDTQENIGETLGDITDVVNGDL